MCNPHRLPNRPAQEVPNWSPNRQGPRHGCLFVRDVRKHGRCAILRHGVPTPLGSSVHHFVLFGDGSTRPSPLLFTSLLYITSLQLDEFWEYFSHMAPAGDLPSVSDYHLFKKGIKPMWEVTSPNRPVPHSAPPPPPGVSGSCHAETVGSLFFFFLSELLCIVAPLFLVQDDANANGGKWVVRLRKGTATSTLFLDYFSRSS